MKKVLKTLIGSILLVVMAISIAACTEINDLQDAETYHLTVQDPQGYIIEDLQENYTAGTAITVKTEILYDASLTAFLDGVSLGSETAVKTGNDYTHWEFYFVMPAHDAVLSFELKDGFLFEESETDREIKSAYVAAHSTEHDPLTEEDIGLRYYGAFDGVYVLFVDVNGTGYLDAICYETVSGVTFIYSSSHSLTVYSAGQFCSVTDAFEKGLLSHDELLTVQQNYRAKHEYLYQWAEGNPDATGEYKLTVQDPKGYIIEALQKTYKAGEKVTVKTEVLFDVDMIAYLDGVSLGSQTAVLKNNEYHWEFYFVMPAHDAVLSFELHGGF